MSDTLVVPVDSPSPAAPASPTPGIPLASPQGRPTSIREAKANLARAASEPATHHSAAQPRTEAGTFAPKPAESAAAPEAPAAPAGQTVQAKPGSQDGATDIPAAAETPAPDGTVVIEIPEGHYLRDRGKTALPPLPKEWETEFRALLNEPVRRAQVTEATARATEAETTAARWERVAEFYVQKAEKLLADPSISLQLAQLRQSQGDEIADRAVRGLLAEDEEAVGELLKQVDQTVQERRLEQESADIKRKAHRSLAGEFPLLTPDERESVIRRWGAMARDGRIPLHRDTLHALAKQYYEQHPAVSALRAREAADADAARKAQEAADAAVAAERAAANPLGRMSPAMKVQSHQVGQAVPQPGSVNVREHRRALGRR